MRQRRQGLYEIVAAAKPMTVRQVFYQATVHGIVDKTEQSYDKVQYDLLAMRRGGELPYDWIADSTRWQRKPTTFSNAEVALRAAARHYRKDLWSEADCYVEIWVEKDALAGVIYPITAAYDVRLMTARGFSSETFCYTSAETFRTLGVPVHVYHFGDFDPSGVAAALDIEAKLRRFAPSTDIHFTRAAVRESQIEAWSLPTRPTKATDSRAKSFGAISVELDAIPADTLRGLVEACINYHMPVDLYEELKLVERDERRMMQNIVEELFS